MTIGGMQVSAWLEWALASLTVCGAVAVGWVAADGLRTVRDWWRDRREPLAEPPPSHPAWQTRLVEQETERLLGLPPERTWEQMTSHQLPLDGGEMTTEIMRKGFDAMWHGPEQERRAPWWEAEHRAAYQALGLDYPSGLLARVREAGQ